MRSLRGHRKHLLVPVLSVLVCCSSSESPVSPDPDSDQSDQGSWPELSGAYLGQPLPGTTPRRFVPDALAATADWFHHGSPVFSPAGDEMFYVHYPTNETIPMDIRFTKLVNGRWTAPERAPFASGLAETAPVFSFDGNRLFYVSQNQDDRYKVVTRSDGEWSAPQSISVPSVPSASRGWQLSISRNETLYFEMSVNGQYDLFFSRLVDGEYSVPESLGSEVNSGSHDFAPYVHPDEEYVIFASQRPAGVGGTDLWITFRTPDGGWSPAINMGAPVNSSGSDSWPYVTPDGEYFFFATSRQGDQGFNPYWMEAGFISELRDGGGQ